MISREMPGKSSRSIPSAGHIPSQSGGASTHANQDTHPIKYLWKKIRKRATHLKYFPELTRLLEKVADTLCSFAHLTNEIKALMGRYCESLGTEAA